MFAREASHKIKHQAFLLVPVQNLGQLIFTKKTFEAKFDVNLKAQHKVTFKNYYFKCTDFSPIFNAKEKRFPFPIKAILI